MLISPNHYISQFEDSDYPDLIKERDRLIDYIVKFESKEKTDAWTDEEWWTDPNPQVRYQIFLEYLSLLCKVMREKYNREYVWGERKLSEDCSEKNKEL